MSLTILNITQFHMKDYYSFLLVSVPACFFTGKKTSISVLEGATDASKLNYTLKSEVSC